MLHAVTGSCEGAVQVRPLRRQLKTLKAWITGQRKDQSPGTRSGVPVVEVPPHSIPLTSAPAIPTPLPCMRSLHVASAGGRCVRDEHSKFVFVNVFTLHASADGHI